MNVLQVGDIALHYRVDGPEDGPPLVFSNSLGTELRVWDPVVERLPEGLRIIRYDKRGHGLSTCPKPPYTMGALVSDAESLLDHLGVKESVIVGLSIGGLIAQGLAAKRTDLVRAMVLSNTGAKIGTREIWDDRIAGVKAGGVEALADATMERWFSKSFLAKPELALWRNMLVRTPD
ncbi:MAG: alpha/beta fold hydrolase, partial [Pseudomonadota bacterium]